MRHAHYAWLVPAALFQVWAVIARAQRWVVLLGQDARLVDAFWAQGVGYLFTNVLPLRMGEPARVLVMAQRCRLPVMQVATTAVVERLLDTATIVLALIAVLPWMQVPALVMRVGMACGGALLLAFVLLLCVVRFHHAGERLWRALGARLPRLPVEAMVARWHEVVRGLAAVNALAESHPSVRLVAGLLGSCPLPCSGRCIRSLQADGTFLEATFMVVALAFAVAVPSSPGFIGIFQLVGQQALVLPFGAKYDVSTALAITITAHLTYYLLTTGLGMLVCGNWESPLAILGGRSPRWSASAMASRQKA